MLLTGVVTLAVLPVELPIKLAAIIVWFLWVGRELASLWRVYGRCFGYRVWPDGAIEVFGGTGTGRRGRVAPGTLITRRWAWLRVTGEDGIAWGELVAGDVRESEQWRRFQVIFRHLPAC